MASKRHWTADDMPDMAGKAVIVTGANSGIGFEAARELARRGAHVVMACRSLERGEQARKELQAELPQASLELSRLDLADLSSVRGFAEDYAARYAALDVLVNNAGVMAIPRRTTADGFEMQFGTNHLGHFALTGLLLERLLDTPGSRVVTVSSGMHQFGTMRFDDLHGEKRYNKWAAYAQSKLANLLFAFELQRKLAAAGAETISVGAHPGYAATGLQVAGPRMEGSKVAEWSNRFALNLFAQSAAMGALPTLYAAVAPDLHGGEYVGPNGFTKMHGYPGIVQPSDKAKDEAVARRLWTLSEELTSVVYPLGEAVLA